MKILNLRKRTQLKNDVCAAINKACAENGSNTPDFILAEYLMNCLNAYEKAHNANEKWYGKELKIF